MLGLYLMNGCVLMAAAQMISSGFSKFNEEVSAIGACISNPCLYNGICTPVASGFLCTCADGRIGMRCEREADDCPVDKSMACNNGFCKLDSLGQPRCICNDGFTGATCVTPSDDCSKNPCRNNGTCLRTPSGYTCQCPDRVALGKNCQIATAELKSCVSTCRGFDFDGKCWRAHAEKVTVSWGYGQFICNSLQTCYNASDDSGLEYIDVQLKPVHMQENDELEFITDADAVLYNYQLIPHILPMEAKSRTAFLECNISQATPLTSGPVESRLAVNRSLLQLGTQYFIADMNPLHRCVFGLRLNVTVKTHDCIDPGDDADSFCHGRGRCYTDFTREHYRCSCCDGYIGDYCETEDPCYTQPCKNDGKCEVLELRRGYVQHRCICPYGYEGNSCSDPTNFCASSPCLNGGFCAQVIQGYMCSCKDGFQGERCQINNDECFSAPCLNGASCIDGSNSFFCQCPSGFRGRLCEVNIDDCASSPCLNGTCLDDINNYTCACASGIGGRNCDIVLHECLSQPCVNGGKCVEKDGGISCSCGIGYTGMLCELKIDLCLHSQFCITSHAKNCTDHGSNVSCACVDGYGGENCGVNIDDCAIRPCMNGGYCVDQVNAYTCQCLEGYSGRQCQIPPAAGHLVDLGFMTDNCEKFEGMNGLDFLEQNVIALLRAACGCDLHSRGFVSGSAHVKCSDDLSGRFVATLVSTDDAFARKLVCGMKEMILKGNTPTVDRNTYIVSIDDHKLCEPPTSELPAKVPTRAEGGTKTTGILIGVLVGFLCLFVALVVIGVRLRNHRRVGVRKIYDRQGVAFTNAAYQIEDRSVESSSFFEENTLDPLDDNCPKWAHEYDAARKVYDRCRPVPAGRLFDLYSPGGGVSKI